MERWLEMDPIIDGKYVLTHKLGEGGMGSVWAARHLVTQRIVAIKRVHVADQGLSEEAKQRFIREAQTASAVRHPSVVQVFDIGAVDDTLYMVMELLEGESLAHYLGRVSKVPPEVVLPCLVPVLDALEQAHTLGIVHRDIKPDNTVAGARPAATSRRSCLSAAAVA
jgi:serine/threonine-protein kinase